VDANCYPINQTASAVERWNMFYTRNNLLDSLTTPISYVTDAAAFEDPFKESDEDYPNRGYYFYWNFLGFYNALRDARAQNLTAWTNRYPVQSPVDYIAPAPLKVNVNYANMNKARTNYVNWGLLSYGPDTKTEGAVPRFLYPNDAKDKNGNIVGDLGGGKNYWYNLVIGAGRVYDPTNGTMGRGDLWRLSSGEPGGK
jgi:hypothetical protein